MPLTKNQKRLDLESALDYFNSSIDSDDKVRALTRLIVRLKEFKEVNDPNDSFDQQLVDKVERILDKLL